MTPNPYVTLLRQLCDHAILDKRYDEAIALLGLIIGAGGDDGLNLYHLGHVLHERADYARAVTALRCAVEIAPNRAEALNDLGVALFRLDRDEEALACIRRALAINPDLPEARETDSIWLLRAGRFREGWRQYEARFNTTLGRTFRRDFPQPQWRGEPIRDRTILLHGEQGYGDTIQFARYAPLVAGRGARVILEVHPGLAWALRTLPGVAQVVETGAALPAFDVHCPLLSLPLIFDTDLDSIPASVPYITADPQRVFAWRERLGPRRRMRIGIAWSGNPRHPEDQRRSIPLDRFARLLPDRADREFHVLQNAVRETDRDTLARLGHVRDHSATLRDFADTAALISLMDLVISVDTAIAHMAGAMGWPAWVLITAVPDWRWMMNRDDSPWYPSLWLFRQPRRDDWDSVLTEVAEQLDTMLS